MTNFDIFMYITNKLGNLMLKIEIVEMGGVKTKADLVIILKGTFYNLNMEYSNRALYKKCHIF